MAKHGTPSAGYRLVSNPIFLVCDWFIGRYTQVNTEILWSSFRRAVVGDIESGVVAWVQVILLSEFNESLDGFSYCFRVAMMFQYRHLGFREIDYLNAYHQLTFGPYRSCAIFQF